MFRQTVRVDGADQEGEGQEVAARRATRDRARRGSVPFLFHASDARPVQEHQSRLPVRNDCAPPTSLRFEAFSGDRRKKRAYGAMSPPYRHRRGLTCRVRAASIRFSLCERRIRCRCPVIRRTQRVAQICGISRYSKRCAEVTCPVSDGRTTSNGQETSGAIVRVSRTTECSERSAASAIRASLSCWR